MTAKTHFDDSIAAATQLVEMYAELRRHRRLGRRGRLDAANQDLLWLPRSAVVVSLSALDAYVHSVLYERIPIVLRHNPVPEALCTAMSFVIPIRNAGGFRDALPVITASDSIAVLTTKLKDDTLTFLSYQAPEKITAGYALIGIEDVFNDVSAIWPGPRSSPDDIKRTLARYVKRRNQIAHEGDREPSGTARQMQPQYAEECKDFVNSLVVRLNRVVYGP